ERATQLLKGMSGFIFTYDPNRRDLRCVASYEAWRESTGTVLKYGKKVALTAAQTKQPLMIDDYRSWSAGRSIREDNSRNVSLISVPMIWQDDAIGAIVVFRHMKKRRFSEVGLKLLTLFGNQAVTAIQHLRLEEQRTALANALEQKISQLAQRSYELENANRQLENAILKREKAEGEIIKRQKYLESVLHHAPYAIVTLNSSHQVVEWNPGAEQIFGYNQEDARGQNLDDLVSGSDRVAEAKAFTERILAGETVSSYETIRYKQDGTPVDVILSAAPIIVGGQLQGAVGLYTDITEHKKLEAQLRQAQRMEAIGTLAGGIAHDFNNLLMTIQGNTSLMLYNMGISDPLYESLKNIEKSVKNGAKLTRQLLGYARKGNYQVTPLDLNDLVKETAEAIARTRKEITIHSELAEDLDAVLADQGQIEQVLLNLYVNASDAMPEGGKLTLITRNMTLKDVNGMPHTSMPENFVELTVSDTGIGMDKKTLGRIFEPFFTTKEMGKGTGLGLASVFGIIKAHGGFMDVESQRGVGTTFKIYLPISNQRNEKRFEPQCKIINGNGTILLVDDEEMVLDAGAKLLEKMGYNVFEAEAGRKAVEIYKENKEKIDMVILDMIMPEMGGGAVYDRIKEIDPDVKILLSSGYSINGQAKEILRRGCDGFIQKPFNMEELSGKLSQLMSIHKRTHLRCS
ncbi:MAG: response regulator, partial [Desulfobacterales bacterium]